MGKLLDGIKAIVQEHGHKFAGIEDVEAWCREQRGKPARCPHCGYTPDAIPSGSDAYAQANCEHRESPASAPQPENLSCSLCGAGPFDAAGLVVHAKMFHERAPAPLPGSEELAEALAEISAAGFGGVAEGMRLHITDLTRRLAEVEAENVRLRPRAEIAGTLLTRTSKAEKRCRELEATIDAMAEAHAHDDQALTAAYMSGAHEGKKQAEAERDALRERCEKLEAALVEIGESEDRICSYCEGEGNRYADGKAHYYSEHAPTIPCPECGGRGRIRDMDSEDMAAVANAALATEVKP